MISVDKTADGIAIKFSDNARISAEKLSLFVNTKERPTFTPSGVLRINLSEEEKDNVLRVARQALLELRLED